MAGMEEIAARAGLTTIQLACQWNLAHDAVACVVPTLIQESGPAARPVEDKRAELAALPAELRLSAEDVARIRGLGDNTGSMNLKGANPRFEGDERPDAWPLSDHLGEVAERWGIEPARDLVPAAA
jgi:aryl-alcohol dehydrogenase-like predicted oxidoreductase